MLWKLEPCFKPVVSVHHNGNFDERSVYRQSGCSVVDSVGSTCAVVAMHELQQDLDNAGASRESDALPHDSPSITVLKVNNFFSLSQVVLLHQSIHSPSHLQIPQNHLPDCIGRSVSVSLILEVLLTICQIFNPLSTRPVMT